MSGPFMLKGVHRAPFLVFPFLVSNVDWSRAGHILLGYIIINVLALNCHFTDPIQIMNSV